MQRIMIAYSPEHGDLFAAKTLFVFLNILDQPRVGSEPA